MNNELLYKLAFYMTEGQENNPADLENVKIFLKGWASREILNKRKLFLVVDENNNIAHTSPKEQDAKEIKDLLIIKDKKKYEVIEFKLE